MKKLLYALGACMLLGLFFSCAEPVNQVNNPNYDPIKEEVRTKFVLNIAAADPDAKTKQSAGAVQRTDPAIFRGLDNASLFCFSLKSGSNFSDGRKMLAADIANTHNADQGAVDYIDLSTALQAEAIDSSGTGGKPRSQRILDLNLKTGVNTMLFYGQAVTDPNHMDGKNDYGLIEANFDAKDMTAIGCWAMPRLKDGTDTATVFHALEKVFEACYNTCFKLGINGNTAVDNKTVSRTIGDYDITGVPIHWSDYVEAVTAPNYYSPIPIRINAEHAGETGYVQLPMVKAAPFEEILGTAYQAFQKVRSGELRAGSGPSIARQMNDLYIVMDDAMHSAPTNDREEIAQLIIERIATYLVGDTQSQGLFYKPGTWPAANPTNTELVWKDVATVVASVRAYGSSVTTPSPLTFGTGTNVLTITLNNFPTIFDLPNGAATMRKWTEASTSEYTQGDFYYMSHAIAMPAMGAGYMTVHDYTYPPALLYYGNSPIRVSEDNDIRNSDFLDGAYNWENGTWSGKWQATPGHVVAGTRGVAMINNVQYGVAMLQTTVKYDSGVASTGLQDNNVANHPGVTGETNNIFYPGDIAGGKNGHLKLTGILIGGQPSRVGWDYLPVSGATFNKMVYDKRINSASGGIDQDGASSYELLVPDNGDLSVPNYTLVYDNYNPSGTQNNEVYVALEFKNELDKDFWGNANIVRQGGTFYLIGKLELTTEALAQFSGSNSKWNNASSIMPPYDAAGNTIQTVRIFMEDFVTYATFVLNATSLQKAYVTVPDLRSSKLSFGLSVDLNWETGLVFENIVL